MLSLFRALNQHKSLETGLVLVLVIATTVTVLSQISPGPVRALSLSMVIFFGLSASVFSFAQPHSDLTD
jgi:hypothetical protein